MILFIPSPRVCAVVHREPGVDGDGLESLLTPGSQPGGPAEIEREPSSRQDNDEGESMGYSGKFADTINEQDRRQPVYSKDIDVGDHRHHRGAAGQSPNSHIADAFCRGVVERIGS